MKKLTLILAVILVFSWTALVFADNSVKNTIRVENVSTTYKIWFIQQRNVEISKLNLPIWWHLIVTNNGGTDFDAGWNPTYEIGKTKVILWTLFGANFSSSDLHVNSWKIDLFAVQKVGDFLFDQEWIYFTTTHKNWFRAFGYWKGLGLQTTGTVHHGEITATAGPRIKVVHGKQKLEIYLGLIGTKGMKKVFSGWDSGREKRSFWLRYTISL